MYNEGDKKNQMGVLRCGILNSKGNLLSVREQEATEGFSAEELAQMKLAFGTVAMEPQQ